MRIKVSEKIQVMFHVSDPIFARTEPLLDEDCEPLEDYSRCNCCGDSTKLNKFKNW